MNYETWAGVGYANRYTGGYSDYRMATGWVLRVIMNSQKNKRLYIAHLMASLLHHFTV